jgi:peptidoglycan hydrolase-like protein with peptidoglycan-binding domain
MSNTPAIEVMKQELQNLLYFTGEVDGTVDDLWIKAQEAFVKTNNIDIKGVKGERLSVMVGQLLCNKAGISAGKVDGYMGPVNSKQQVYYQITK